MKRMCPSCRVRLAPSPEPLRPAEATSAAMWACTCELYDYEEDE